MVASKTAKAGWSAVGSVVTGASHIRNDQECQDAVYFRNEKNHVIACVADGHGSKSCPYSAEGAKAAAELTYTILKALLPNIKVEKDIRLPKMLEVEWKSLVRELHTRLKREPEAEPLTLDEVGATVDTFPYILYGTTLLAVAVTQEFIFALQIGDGNILLIDENGTTPILAVAENIGEDTESLCLKDAWTHIRTHMIPFKNDSPAMLLLATDGYANSFSDSSGFYKAGTDFFQLWQEEGLPYIGKSLPGWLRKSSDKGSGDDIAMAILAFEPKTEGKKTEKGDSIE